jgi:molybdate transport system regulatory protein
LSDEEKVFGEGPCDLLEKVAARGSLKKAAEDMGMSYSKAWGLVRRAEKHLGFPLLIRKTGGNEGGGSALTAGAENLIRRYREFCREAAVLLNDLYRKYFNEQS